MQQEDSCRYNICQTSSPRERCIDYGSSQHTNYPLSEYQQQKKINCVRMFLGVQYMSQISTVDRTNFVPGILEGDDRHLCYQTILTKPQQE